MAKVCPMNGCKAKEGMCIHDKMMLVMVVGLLLIGGWFYVSGNKQTKVTEVTVPTHESASMGGENMMGAGVVFMGGTISLEQGKTMTPLSKEYVFETGVKVSPAGLVTKKDGTTVQLKEGESAWADGSVMKAGEEMMNEATGTMMKSEGMMTGAGTYQTYAPEKVAKFATAGKVVLFFRASWCPTCKALDADIRSHLGNIPEQLTILDVDYDNSTALKQQYGVTYQHTLVEVDAQGKLIKKWSGSPTLAALVSEVQ